MIHLELLVSKFKNKNENAFKELYDMYHKSIHGFICNIIRDKSLSDELTQDTFIKAWNNSESYCPKKGRIFTWLLTIARHTAIDKTRSKTYKESKKNRDISVLEYLIPSTENLHHKTDSLGIENILHNLKPKRLKIIELLYFKGFTQKEVSEYLDIPLGTVKTRSRNSIEKLRTIVL